MTAQAHEELILDGRPTSMMTCPPLPLHDPRLRAVDVDAITGPLPDDVAFTRSTACWRGYIGFWEIKDDRLYLCRVIGAYQLDAGAPVLADWVSDTLRVPQGKLLQYVHMGFESIYERELEILVEAGVVVDRMVVEHSAAETIDTPALASLIEVVARHQDDEIRSLAMQRIRTECVGSGEEDERIIPFMIGSLTDRSFKIRSMAVEGLGDYGVAAAAALPVLTELQRQNVWDARVGRAIWRVGLDSGGLPGLIARLHVFDHWYWRWDEIYELLEAFLEIGSASAEAAPALLRLESRIRRYVSEKEGSEDWLRVIDAIDQTLATVGATIRLGEIEGFILSLDAGQSTALDVQPGALRQTLFYDVDDEELVEEASRLGVAVDERHYAISMSYADHPGQDGYLAGLRIVCRTGQGAPQQPAPIAELLKGFVQHQRDEWIRGALAEVLGTDNAEASDMVGFGLRVEDLDAQVYRIWSRVA